MAWLDRLEAEHDNLAGAISWLLDQDQDQPGPALQLSAMTWQTGGSAAIRRKVPGTGR